MLKKILAIAGKPGLFRLVSKGKRTLVVETLDEARRRMPAFATERIISLGDVAMYTDQEEVPLREVLKTILEQQEGKPVAIDLKQASRDDLAAFMAKALPTYDRERVHTSD
ncbi:MAG: DUF5606 domain-containing protein, partial [Prevotellaceae bacterium]|nr:DUF5606 domain-containing protein [Prevotellaceae bacterium]